MTHGLGLSDQATGCRIVVDLNDHGGAGCRASAMSG